MNPRRLRNPPARPVVLIVEAHDDTRAMYALALTVTGFVVVAVQNSSEAPRRALEIHPDIILADLPMPNDDGWQFLEHLKQNPHTRDIPIIAMSAYVERSVEERAERKGFAAFFPKPCSPDELAMGLRRVLDGHAMFMSGNEDRTKQCPRCRLNTLLFKSHVPVLSPVMAVTRTGTDPHDGPNRLRYESAWVCENSRCDYKEVVGEH